MKRIALAVTVVLAASAAAAFATAGSAQSPPKTTSLHLISTTQPGVGFAPRHDARPGDQVGAGDIITGDETGIDRTTCTVISKRDALCTAVAKLSKGSLTAQTLVTLAIDAAPSTTTYAITGGTGAYAGARGTAVVTDVANTDRATIDVALRP